MTSTVGSQWARASLDDRADIGTDTLASTAI
jgi:hypothetical protein